MSKIIVSYTIYSQCVIAVGDRERNTLAYILRCKYLFIVLIARYKLYIQITNEDNLNIGIYFTEMKC